MGGIELSGFRAFRLGFWARGFGSGSGSGSGLRMVLDCVRGGGGGGCEHGHYNEVTYGDFLGELH